MGQPLATIAERRARFRALHAADRLFVMPNPWDAGSARLLASCGFEALATTSAGFAWALGKHDQTVTRDELVAHVAELSAATDLPLNVDSERCYPDDPGGVAGTVASARRRRSGRLLDRGLRPGCRPHRRGRGRRRARCRRGRGIARPVRADAADRAGREPHPRRRRPRRHDRPPDRLPRSRRRRAVRPGSHRSRADRPCRDRGGAAAERPRAAGRADGRRVGRGRCPPSLDREPAGGAGRTARWSRRRTRC